MNSKSNKRLEELTNVFKTKNIRQIIKTVSALRNEKPSEGIIEELVVLFDKSSEKEIRQSVENFMNDFKDQTSIPEIISEIKNDRHPLTKKMLLSSCWQSGLDYSQHANDIAEIFLTSDYACALECLTIFGESMSSLEMEEKEIISKFISDNCDSVNSENQILIEELQMILRI